MTDPQFPPLSLAPTHPLEIRWVVAQCLLGWVLVDGPGFDYDGLCVSHKVLVPPEYASDHWKNYPPRGVILPQTWVHRVLDKGFDLYSQMANLESRLSRLPSSFERYKQLLVEANPDKLPLLSVVSPEDRLRLMAQALLEAPHV